MGGSILPELSHEQQMEAEAFFPELAKSKDESIRKCIKYAIDKLFSYEKIICTVSKEEVLAWLEKQGEKFGCEVNCTTIKM